MEAIEPRPKPDKYGRRCDRVFRALEMAGKEGRRRGQPPMVGRFREVERLVEQLERQGVPFGVSRTSIMNQRVRKILNERAASSSDPRKSRRKQISGDAVKKWLKDVQTLRRLLDHFAQFPYED